MGELSGDYLTTREVAELLELSKSRVDQFAQDGRLRSVMVGQTRLFLRSDVEAFKKLPRPPGKPPAPKPRKKKE